MFIKEYDKNGILTYIVDKRTGKGYKVKKGIKERELNDFLIKLSNTQILEDISKKRINRIPIIRIKNIKGLSYVLIVSYTLLVVCNLVLLASTPLPDVDIKKSSPIDLLMVTAVLVLGIYFIHELSHIAVARFQGIMIRKISFKGA